MLCLARTLSTYITLGLCPWALLGPYIQPLTFCKMVREMHQTISSAAAVTIELRLDGAHLVAVQATIMHSTEQSDCGAQSAWIAQQQDIDLGAAATNW